MAMRTFTLIAHSNGGVPISLEQPFQFVVAGGLKSINNISTTNSNQGSYSLTFRLPTMCAVNTDYTVYSSTASSGLTTTKNTLFNCQFGDFNGDGVIDYADFFIFASNYNIYWSGNTSYNHLCDMNQDGKINSEDFFAFMNCYLTYWSLSHS